MLNTSQPLAKLDSDKTYLVYDGECPVCNSYVHFVRLREAVGPVEMHNARDGGEVVNFIIAEGLDLDEGMVLWYQGRLYHGHECINMLALMSTRSGVFNRLNAVLFSSPKIARILYPVLRLGRNVLLRLLGKKKLHLA